MSTLAREVAEQLSQAKIKDLGIVRAYALPPVRSPDKLNAILVSEVTTVPNTYGSNQFTDNDETIEISIYYGTQKKVPIDTFEHSIVSFFLQRNWTLLPYSGHYHDPDTQQLCIDFQFRRRKAWNYMV